MVTDTLTQEQEFSRLDSAFANFLTPRSSLNSDQKAELKTLLCKLSFQQSQGHNCLNISPLEKQLVLKSGLLSAQQIAPLKLEENRLYLYRYWSYEQKLAEQIKTLLSKNTSDQQNQDLINRYFIQLINEVDWQREAAIMTINQFLSIITGGPGTGKTTTVVKILAVLQELASKNKQSLHIALAAPTGKAAMRLQESIGTSKKRLPCSEKIMQLIPEAVTTLHRLLGAKPPSPYFKHDASHPLPYDLVVIDEASMVDLALMSKLVDALKPSSKLILLGDKDQLASVESGAVLADLTAALPLNTIELKKSHRFEGDIKDLAVAVNEQSIDKAWELLNNNSDQISLLTEDLINFIAQKYNAYLTKINNKAEFPEVYASFNDFQVLCSNRRGEQGAIEINQKVEEHLHQKNKIHITGQWYIGRPIMVIQNNASMQLYNGDIGICLFDKEFDRLAVHFLRSDGSVKKVLPSRVPTHETVFAMTIHKSQGSEFDECLCVLPETINPVLTKELIYTAITRAKTKLKIATNYAVFSQTLHRRVERTGGLFEKLADSA